MNTEYTQFGKGFFVRWVVASAIGLLVGFAIYFLLVVNFASEQGFILRTLISIIGGAIFGIAVGGAQLIVLRREVSGTNRWMVANLIGGAVGGIIALPVGETMGDAMGFNMAVTAGGIVLGISLGTAQLMVLRQHLYGGGWWVLAHAMGIPLGWMLGNGLGGVVYNMVVGGVGEDTGQIIATMIFAFLFFGSYGLITGGVLVRLLQSSRTMQTA